MKYLLFVALAAFAACNDKPKTPVHHVTAGTPGKIENWKVPNGIAIAMVKSAQGKTCKAFSVKNPNYAVKAEIDSAYPESAYTRTFVQARYITDADAEMYRRMRNLKPGDPRGRVKGLCNSIYKLTARSLNVTEETAEFYFDFQWACPPPPDCDRDTLVSNPEDTVSFGG